MSENETCVFEYQLRERSVGFRIYNLVFSVVVYVIIILTLLGWYFNQKHDILRKRSGRIVLFIALGVSMATYAGPVWRFETSLLGGCVGENFFYFAGFPTLAVATNVRLIIWVNRIKYNYEIGETIAINGLEEINTGSKELSKRAFRASNSYGYLIMICFIVPYYISMYLLLEFYICGLCIDYVLPATIIFVGTAAIVVIYGFYLVYVYRDVPDLLGLRKEVVYVYSITAVLGFTGYGLQVTDAAEFSTQDPQSFDWAVLTDFAFVYLWLHVATAKVIRSYLKRATEEKKKFKRPKLEDILSTIRGRKIFELFAATDLTIENMLFYNAVTKWKQSFDQSNEKTRTDADRIMDTYVKPNSQLEINLGSSTREKLIEEFQIKLEIFDEALNIVLDLMALNSLERFLRSDFYKFYNGEVTPDSGFEWIQSTGVTYYNILGRNKDSLVSSTGKSV